MVLFNISMFLGGLRFHFSFFGSLSCYSSIGYYSSTLGNYHRYTLGFSWFLASHWVSTLSYMVIASFCMYRVIIATYDDRIGEIVDDS